MMTFEQFNKKKRRTKSPKAIDPPAMIVLKRISMRMFPNNRKVATYRAKELKKEILYPAQFDQ